MQTIGKIKTHNLGYPRIGENRELKRATEAFWNGSITEAQLFANAAKLRRHHWQKQQAIGIDLIPSNDFSFYDQMGDTAALVGCVPKRFAGSDVSVDLTTSQSKNSVKLARWGFLQERIDLDVLAHGEFERNDIYRHRLFSADQGSPLTGCLHHDVFPAAEMLLDRSALVSINHSAPSAASSPSTSQISASLFAIIPNTFWRQGPK